MVSTRTWVPVGLAVFAAVGLLFPVAPGFDWSAHPQMCKEPFTCQDTRVWQVLSLLAFGVGRADPSLYCAEPQYWSFAEKCLVQNDKVGAAHYLYKDVEDGNQGDHQFELDAGFCFIEQHCLETSVTKSTTMEEAEKLCDKRYGTERRSCVIRG